MRGLVVLVTLACIATAQHQPLIDYLERRLLAIEVNKTLLVFLLNPKLQSPPDRKLSGTRQMQWNADEGISWGK